MLLSELLERVHSASTDLLDYQVVLASPDPVEGDAN